MVATKRNNTTMTETKETIMPTAITTVVAGSNNGSSNSIDRNSKDNGINNKDKETNGSNNSNGSNNNGSNKTNESNKRAMTTTIGTTMVAMTATKRDDSNNCSNDRNNNGSNDDTSNKRNCSNNRNTMATMTQTTAARTTAIKGMTAITAATTTAMKSIKNLLFKCYLYVYQAKKTHTGSVSQGSYGRWRSLATGLHGWKKECIFGVLSLACFLAALSCCLMY